MCLLTFTRFFNTIIFILVHPRSHYIDYNILYYAICTILHCIIVYYAIFTILHYIYYIIIYNIVIFKICTSFTFSTSATLVAKSCLAVWYNCSLR